MGNLRTIITTRRWVLIFLFAYILSLSSCVHTEISSEQMRPRVALVLGAGASRGFAHVGVLKVLESNGIPTDMIVGTSAGSFVGSLYAYGYDAFDLQKMAFTLQYDDLIDMMFLPNKGFIKGERIQDFINRKVMNTRVEDLKIPFYPVATDLKSGKEVVLNSGDTGAAVRASCAIPGIFKPVEIDGRMYVDGGAVSPVAVETAIRLGADIVIAVDISSGISEIEPESIIDTVLQTIDIMYANLASRQLAKADIVITPNVGFIPSNDFSLRHEAILEGERAAIDALPLIKEKLTKLKADFASR